MCAPIPFVGARAHRTQALVFKACGPLTHPCTYFYTYTHTYIHIYSHTCTCTHLYTHTHTHLHPLLIGELEEDKDAGLALLYGIGWQPSSWLGSLTITTFYSYFGNYTLTLVGVYMFGILAIISHEVLVRMMNAEARAAAAVAEEGGEEEGEEEGEKEGVGRQGKEEEEEGKREEAEEERREEEEEEEDEGAGAV